MFFAEKFIVRSQTAAGMRAIFFLPVGRESVILRMIIAMANAHAAILNAFSLPVPPVGNGFWRVSVRAVRYYFYFFFFWFYYAQPGAGGRPERTR